MVIEFALFVFVFIGIMIAIIEIKDFRNLILKIGAIKESMNCEEIINKLHELCKYEPNRNTKNSVCFSYNGSFLCIAEKWMWTDLSRIQIDKGHIENISSTNNGLEIEIKINNEKFIEIIKGDKHDI